MNYSALMRWFGGSLGREWGLVCYTCKLATENLKPTLLIWAAVLVRVKMNLSFPILNLKRKIWCVYSFLQCKTTSFKDTCFFVLMKKLLLSWLMLKLSTLLKSAVRIDCVKMNTSCFYLRPSKYIWHFSSLMQWVFRYSLWIWSVLRHVDTDKSVTRWDLSSSLTIREKIVASTWRKKRKGWKEGRKKGKI